MRLRKASACNDAAYMLVQQRCKRLSSQPVQPQTSSVSNNPHRPLKIFTHLGGLGIYLPFIPVAPSHMDFMCLHVTVLRSFTL